MPGTGGVWDLMPPVSNMAINEDPASFQPGDVVSYRVTGSLSGIPFIGTLVEVHEDYVIIRAAPEDPSSQIQGTRESHPLVDEAVALG